MAIVEKSGFLKFKDVNGDTTLMYPITTKDNVDGLDEIEERVNTVENNYNALNNDLDTVFDGIYGELKNSVDHISNTSNPHNVTAEQVGAVSYNDQNLTDDQKAKARENIGVPDITETTTTNEITWDGDTTGKTVVDCGDGFSCVHISDRAPEHTVFTQEGFAVTMVQGSMKQDMHVPAEETAQNIVHVDGGYLLMGSAVCVVFADNQTISVPDTGDIVFPKKGMYFGYINIPEIGPPTKVTCIASPLLSVTNTFVKESALPASVAKKPIKPEWDSILNNPIESCKPVLFETQTIEFVYDIDGYKTDNISLAAPFLAGQQIVAYFDGTEYSLVGIPFSPGAAFANEVFTIISAELPDEGPVMIILMNNGDTSTSHEIGITEAGTVVSSVTMASSTEGSKKRFKLSLNDDASPVVTNVDDSTDVTTVLTSKDADNFARVGQNVTVQQDSAPTVKLTMNDSSCETRLYKNASTTADYGTTLADYKSDGTRDSLILCRNNALDKKLYINVGNEDGTSNTPYYLYGEHHKPTASEVGALSTSGGTVNGDVNVAGVLKANGQQAFYYATSSNSQTVGTANATGGTTICCGSSANTNIQGANVKTNNLIPNASNTYTLGNTSARWKAIYSNAAVDVVSDRRLKRDIADLNDEALAKFIAGLNVVSYNYNDDPEEANARIGLVAQDVQTADPEIAKYFVAEDQNGMLGLKSADLVFPLIAAVQRLTAEVAELKAELANR